MLLKRRYMILTVAMLITSLCISAVPSFAESITHVYDDLNRLTRTEYGDGTALVYDYDEVGNRTQKYVRPTTCTNLPTRIAASTPVYYPTFQAVFAAAIEGATIQSMNISFIENLNFNGNLSITLDGGYGCDYTINPDYTTINGSMTITSGAVTVNNIVLQ